ncbi:MAG: hypothetical protein IIW47_03380 [Bacteroidales bacterium]|nr:hypothetical protein [Bacteroidales bacterium]
MEKDSYTYLFSKVTDTAVEYLNTRVEGYKYKMVGNLSLLTNKIMVALIATMLGTVILLLSGFALAFIIGALLGSTAWGFIIVTLLFTEALVAIYLCRRTLFIKRITQMYLRMFFGDIRKHPRN